MVSRTHFLTEFDLHLVDLTFVPKVHNRVQMGLRGIDESLFPIIAPRLLGARGASGTNRHLYRRFKDRGFDRDSYRFRLPGHCGIFTAEMCNLHFSMRFNRI
jgi:hypothetical protein